MGVLIGGCDRHHGPSSLTLNHGSGNCNDADLSSVTLLALCSNCSTFTLALHGAKTTLRSLAASASAFAAATIGARISTPRMFH